MIEPPLLSICDPRVRVGCTEICVAFRKIEILTNKPLDCMGSEFSDAVVPVAKETGKERHPRRILVSAFTTLVVALTNSAK